MPLGSINSVGEFFNPGLNCSDILDKLEDAKDGFYWITLKGSNPIKVGVFMNLIFSFLFINRLLNVLFMTQILSLKYYFVRTPWLWIEFRANLTRQYLINIKPS